MSESTAGQQDEHGGGGQPWSPESVRALLHIPFAKGQQGATPASLLQDPDLRSWLAARGGLEAVYEHLRQRPLSATQRKMLEFHLANPGETLAQAMDALDIPASTYNRRLKELLPLLAGYLNAWAPAQVSTAPPAPDSLLPATQPLPTPISTFVGRVRELSELSALLQRPELRLLTLAGPGGVGKTRLALQLAHQVAPRFADGAVFVPLAAIHDPQLASPALAQALGLKETSGTSPLVDLVHYLRHKQLLLVLDNVEQIVATTPALVELLTATSGVKLLVTSREVLRVRGEHVYMLRPLMLPETRPPVSWEEVGAAEAVQLLVERAQTVQPSFALTPDNSAAIVEICTQLEGVPLALELAASQLRIMSPAMLLRRLSGRLALPSREIRDLPERHQTLRHAIDWSYELLPPAEQQLFRQLSLFAGGCTLEAAEQICALAELHADDIAAGLDALVGKSLVMLGPTPQHDVRFSMLETIREYACELLPPDEAAALRERYVAYYLALIEQARPELIGRQQLEWTERLEQEHDNLRQALEWSRQEAGESFLALASGLWRFWYLQGHLTEGRGWLEELLARVPTQVEPRYAEALAGLGWLAEGQGDVEYAARYYAQSLELWQQLGDGGGVAFVLYSQAKLALLMHDLERATALYEQALASAEQAGDRRWVRAAALNGLGAIYGRQGQFGQASTYLKTSLALMQELGDHERLAGIMLNLGLLLLEQEQYEQAEQYLLQNNILAQRLGNKTMSARILYNLATMYKDRADYQQARAALAGARRQAEETGDSMTLWFIDDASAHILLQEGQHDEARQAYRDLLARWRSGEASLPATLASALEGLAELTLPSSPARAATLLGAADHIVSSNNIPRERLGSAAFARLSARLAATLGPAALAQAWEQGSRLSLDELLALAGVEEPSDSPRRHGGHGEFYV